MPCSACSASCTSTAATKSSFPILSEVLNYKHPELMERLKRKLHLSHEDAVQLFEDVKKYLYLCMIAGKKIAPTERIDAGWHEFLMFTKDYMDFCTKHFGTFIHHTPAPTLGPRPVMRVSDTVKLAVLHFGSVSMNWHVNSADCSPDFDCNGDSTCS